VIFTSISRIQRPLRPASVFSMMMIIIIIINTAVLLGRGGLGLFVRGLLYTAVVANRPTQPSVPAVNEDRLRLQKHTRFFLFSHCPALCFHFTAPPGVLFTRPTEAVVCLLKAPLVSLFVKGGGGNVLR